MDFVIAAFLLIIAQFCEMTDCTITAHEGIADGPPSKICRIENSFSITQLENPSVLNELKDKKLVFIHGKVANKDDAVIILEKKPFDTSVQGLRSLFSENSKLEKEMSNDVYSTYVLTPSSDQNKCRATVICPATRKHIEKYGKHEVFVIEETEDDYKEVTLPFLQRCWNEQFSVQWVYNILDKTSEADRIVFEDNDSTNGFVLLPDMKWDISDLSSLYLIALPHHRGLKTIRDLRREHLPLLENILTSGQRAVREKYDIPASKLRIYFHYQPSYYHLHVHFTHINFDAPGTTVTRAHLLTDVIGNIKIKSDFYKKKTLTFVGRENDKLVEALRKRLGSEEK